MKIRNIKYNLIKNFLPFAMGVLLIGCKSFLDVEPVKDLPSSKAYRDVNDANAAVLGIYGQLMRFSEQYIVLNELRGDLVDVTGNNNDDLNEINLHNIKSGNIYADPTPIYKIILDCNDALMNFEKMRKDKRLTEGQYQQRFSDIGSVRAWLYFQMSIHYNRIPYVTEAFNNADNIKLIPEANYIERSALIDTLINFMEALPWKLNYSDVSLNTTYDSYNTRLTFIDKNYLLAELYLWKGDYTKAVINYRKILDGNGYDVNGMASYAVFKITSFSTYNLSKWSDLFSTTYTKGYEYETLWLMYFDYKFEPYSPFIELFSGVGGKYYLKPSQQSIDNWKTEVVPGDFTDDTQRGQNASWGLEGGQPVVKKLIALYNTQKPEIKNSRWYLCRAPLLHLHMAEAIARQALIDTSSVYPLDSLSRTLVNGGLGYKDYTNWPYPFNLPSRRDNALGIVEAYYTNVGIRGRVSQPSIYVPTRYKVNKDSTVLFTENLIIDEAARELAYEGHRWPDLLRIALRRKSTGQDPDGVYLADKIYAKFKKAGNSQAEVVRTRLLDEKNWYLPFK